MTTTPPAPIPGHRTPRARGTSAAALGLVCVAVVGLRTVAAPMHVQGDSMRPTVAPGDVVLVAHYLGPWDGIRAGDLVVYERSDGERSLKRVVALAGQRVAIEDAQLLVDGRAVAEPWVDRDSIDGLYFGPVLVPADAIFVLGDNRARSVDSRQDGAVPVDDVVGHVVLTPWSPP